jgi:mannose-6-phosphate isomerase-like protein (cupin superfamily)
MASEPLDHSHAGRAEEPQRQTIIHYKLGDTDNRPWGFWRVVDLGQNFVVKQVTIRPGGRLSLHYHHGRNENWVVVAGKAGARIGETHSILMETQAIFVPVNIPHRLENTGDVDVVLIEIQTGTLLDETDIVRLEDVYGRAPNL